MSLHYLEGEEWTAGRKYSFEPNPSCTELGIDLIYTEGDTEQTREIDLLPYIN